MSVLVDRATVEHWKAAGKWVEFAQGGPSSDRSSVVNQVKRMLDNPISKRLEDGWYPSGRDDDGEVKHDRHVMIWVRHYEGLLAALVAEQTPPANWTEPAPCRRCGGDGLIVIGWHAAAYENIEGSCPDCKGSGKQRLAVQVPCQVCGDMAGHGGFMMACCGATGRVTVAWAIQEWGPNLIERVPVRAGDSVFVVTGNPDDDGLSEVPPGIDPTSLIGQWARGGRIEPT